jgi:hypothetical protein
MQSRDLIMRGQPGLVRAIFNFPGLSARIIHATAVSDGLIGGQVAHVP